MLRSSGTFEDETTVAALPYHYFVLCKHLASLDVLHESQVTLFVTLFSNGDVTVHSGDFIETFSLSLVSEAGIISAPLLILTGSGSLQVIQRLANYASGIASGDLYTATLQPLKHALSVLLLLLSSLGEDSGNLLITLLLSHTGKIGVAVASL